MACICLIHVWCVRICTCACRADRSIEPPSPPLAPPTVTPPPPWCLHAASAAQPKDQAHIAPQATAPSFVAPSAEAHTAAPVAAYTARSTLGSRDLGHSEPTNFIVRAVGKGVLAFGPDGTRIDYEICELR